MFDLEQIVVDAPRTRSLVIYTMMAPAMVQALAGSDIQAKSTTPRAIVQASITNQLEADSGDGGGFSYFL